MQDWQNRVIEEASELEQKILRLDAYIWSGKAECLFIGDKDTLLSQLHFMKQYLNTLKLRISRFKD